MGTYKSKAKAYITKRRVTGIEYFKDDMTFPYLIV